jgi:hypothetical protein
VINRTRLYGVNMKQHAWAASVVVAAFNLLNASPILALNTTYGTAWQRPLQILQGRLLKFGVQVDF